MKNTASKKINENIKKIIVKNQTVENLEKRLAWYESFFTNATDALFIIQPETWSVLDANEYAA